MKCWPTWREEGSAATEAVKWFRAAAEQGHKAASANLALCYLAGDGTDIDLREAARWYRVTAEDGYRESQFILARILYAGGEEVRDRREAARWIASLARAQDMDKGSRAVACAILAHLYLWGEGVAGDAEEAARRNREAAEAGNHTAQHNWAMCLSEGVGVETDLPEAVQWFRKAAAVRFAAKHAVGVCLWLGRGTERDEAKAFEWFRVAAPGHPPAMFRLAVCFHEGAGTERDLEKAGHWLLMASDRGHQGARECLGPARPAAPRIQDDVFERRKNDDLQPAWLDPTEEHFRLPSPGGR
jgi:TPR repeat protein